MSLIQSWRWYGPNDPVTLKDIKQAGANGIVSALHHVPHGDVWPLEEILERKQMIEAEGLEWVVVESVPVHESIKTRDQKCNVYLENYKQTLINLSKAGLGIVCYNFMPVLDWTRTNLEYSLPNGSKALYFDWSDLALFDMFVLKRKGADADYSEETIQKSIVKYEAVSKAYLQNLSDIILMGVPTEGSITLDQLTQSIEIYKNIGKSGLQENLSYFLNTIMPLCEELDICMTIHPDDPPYPILGLPRIAGNKEDLISILNSVDHKNNGICFCTGSLGAGKHNDPVDILKGIGNRVYFAHLRNVRKDTSGNFFESDHLDGDVDMYGVMKELLAINATREKKIPFRPDHGHQMLDDLHKVTNPGYSAIGRLKGLAELRGLELGIKRNMGF